MMDLERILDENYHKWKDREYIYTKVDGNYQAVTYGDFFEKVHALAAYLASLGLVDKPVIIYGENSYQFMVADFAVLNYVGISVCISKEWKETDVLRTIRLLDAPCLIYVEEKQDVVDKIVSEMPELKCISMGDFQDIKPVEERCAPRDENLCCKIVFSSGTTAKPKAVMLSKKNVFAGMDSLYKRCPFHEEDVDYLFLPLSHTYGGIYNFLYSLVFGFSIYLCSGINDMAKEILEVNPTIFCGVPAIYRKFYEGYGSNIHKAFGNRMKYLFCGGAYFDEDIRKAYKDSGLNMMEAYGLSETASTFAIQYPKDPDTRSVGTIAEDIDVKIIEADDTGVGEIVVKGDNVFMGYAGDADLTEKAFTEDGYFRTGDMGYIETDELNGGYKLYITGRIKKVLIGENGENVEPAPIEKLIYEKNANISKALMYVQDGRLSCHVYLYEHEDRDWEAFFEMINGALLKHEKIRSYDVVVDSIEKRLKQ